MKYEIQKLLGYNKETHKQEYETVMYSYDSFPTEIIKHFNSIVQNNPDNCYRLIEVIIDVVKQGEVK